LFQDRIKELEREQQVIVQQKRSSIRRTERHNRTVFKKRIQDLKGQGLVTRKTLWRDIWTIVKDEAVYTDMVGQPGSVPVDFLRDVQCFMELEYLDAIAGRIPLHDVSDHVKPDVTKYLSEEKNRVDVHIEDAYKMLRKAEPRVRSSDSFREVTYSSRLSMSILNLLSKVCSRFRDSRRWNALSKSEQEDVYDHSPFKSKHTSICVIRSSFNIHF
jgi:hypothetical protein